MPRRWSVRVLAVWIGALALAGCAPWWGPRTVEISPLQLQRAIDRQLPIGRTLWGQFEVRLSGARISLLPDEQRLSMRLELEMREWLTPRTHRAALSISHGVRFEPADDTVRLTRPRIGAIEIDGTEQALNDPLARWAAQAVELLLNDHVLYTLSSDALLTLQQRGLRPGELHVGPTGLILTLLPLASGS